MSVRPVPSMMLRATCSRFSDWPEYHCSPSLDTPASPFPAPRLPGHAPASPAPCQFRLLCFAFPVSPFPLHPFRFTLHFSRFNPPDPQPRCVHSHPVPQGSRRCCSGQNWQVRAVAHGGISFYITKRKPISIGVPRRSVLRAGPPRPVPQLRNPFQVRFVTQWMKPHNGTS